jgi:hypothetical protein
MKVSGGTQVSSQVRDGSTTPQTLVAVKIRVLGSSATSATVAEVASEAIG